MAPITEMPAISSHHESRLLDLVTDRASRDENTPQLALAPAPHQGFTAESFSRATTNETPVGKLSADRDITYSYCRLPPELRFTPVNSPVENSGPAKPKRPVNVCLSQNSDTTHQRYAGRCRLIGFTPLVEDTLTSSDEDSMQFLGPRKVKAKEVAPCALFYKRADVFVSSEMKSQNVLSYSENHYQNLRFDVEVSVNQLEYVPQHSDQSHEASQLSKYVGDHGQKQTEEVGLDIKLEPLGVIQEPICHTFARDGLTSVPLAPEAISGFVFDRDCFHKFGDETDSPLTANSGVEQNVSQAIPLNDVASDLEQSTSSISSSGIKSSLWDTTVSSLTRATSPVSSIYSNVSPSCNHQSLTVSLTEEQYAQSPCISMSFSHITLGTEKRPAQILMTKGPFGQYQTPIMAQAPTGNDYCLNTPGGIPGWQEDEGSLADDENDSDYSSIQLESDDDHELDGCAGACFQLINSASLTGVSGNDEAAFKTKSDELSRSRI